MFSNVIFNEMTNVTIKKGSLFDAPAGSIICHACNTQGIWGAGVAKIFKDKNPKTYKIYKSFCDRFNDDLLGITLIFTNDDRTHFIGNLFTSSGWGTKPSTEQEILKNTRAAIQSLIKQNKFQKAPIHMCKINSGIFNVPWEKTQKILEEFKDQQFTVWEI